MKLRITRTINNGFREKANRSKTKVYFCHKSVYYPPSHKKSKWHFIPVKTDISFNQDILCVFPNFTTFKMTRYRSILINLCDYLYICYHKWCIIFNTNVFRFSSHICYSCINMILSKDYLYLQMIFIVILSNTYIQLRNLYIHSFLLILLNKKELYRSSMLLGIIKKKYLIL